MAQRTIVTLTSDLSDKEIPKDGGRTVNFALDGVTYEIDLLTKEVDQLAEALTPYMENGRRLAKNGKPFKSSTVAPKRNDLDDVRAWAKENGYKVSDRGRIAKSVLDAYDAR